MSIQELGSIGELLAAIATIATLVYLALQIRQSNRSHQLAAVARFGESSEKWIGQVVQDPGLLDVYIRGLTDPGSLDRMERARFNLLVLQCLRGAEVGWLQVNWGVVDPDYWEGFCELVRQLVGTPAGKRAFDQNRSILSARFVAEVDRIIEGCVVEPGSHAQAN